MLADAVWDAAGVERAPYRIVDLADDAALDAATAELGSELGAVWSGDARDGFNGGGDFVRWVRDDRDRAAAAAFFRPRCDRVRVMPFLEGVPCSIHGFVLPDGTAALRPVEIVTLRDPAARTMAYRRAGQHLGPAAGRPRGDARRRPSRGRAPAARRTATAARSASTACSPPTGSGPPSSTPGCRPAPRRSREVDRRFFTFLQAALVAGIDTGLTAADVEALVPAMDADPRRQGRRVRSGDAGGVRGELPRHLGRPVASPAPRSETGNVFSVGVTAERAVRQGRARAPRWCPASGSRRSTPRCCAFLDARTAPRFGAIEPAPDVVRWPDVARVVVVGGGFGGLASAARLAKLGHEVTLLERLDTLGGAVSDGLRGRLRVGRRADVDAAPGGHPRPVPQERPPGRAGAGARAARPGARALVRGRHACSACPGHSRAAQLRAVRRARRPGSAGSGSSTSTRSPTTGRCCAARTSRTRGTPPSSPATWRRGSTAARCCTSG